MKFLTAFIFISSLFLFTNCEEENEVTPRDYPRLNTLGVTNLSENGATFNAEITYRANFEIIEYGFVWDLSNEPTLYSSQKVNFSGNLETNNFSADITANFTKGNTYYVKAFVITEDNTVYGKAVGFIVP